MKKTNSAGLFASLLTLASLSLANFVPAAAAASGTDDLNRIDGGTITYVHEQEPPCLWGGWVQQAYLAISAHNPLIYRGRQIGDFTVNGELPPSLFSLPLPQADAGKAIPELVG